MPGGGGNDWAYGCYISGTWQLNGGTPQEIDQEGNHWEMSATENLDASLTVTNTWTWVGTGSAPATLDIASFTDSSSAYGAGVTSCDLYAGTYWSWPGSYSGACPKTVTGGGSGGLDLAVVSGVASLQYGVTLKAHVSGSGTPSTSVSYTA